MRALDAATMRRLDGQAIARIGIPGLVLMENAALGVVEAIGEAFPAAERVAIVCGPGNNGGDGLAVGRQLAVRGYDPPMVLVLGGKAPSEDCAAQLTICRNLGLEVAEVETEADLAAALADLGEVDLWVDALFGTGLTRPLAGPWAATVAALNRSRAPVLAVDLASGLDASRGERIGPTVEADFTVTFAAPKLAHVLTPAADAGGELAVADLGLPATLVGEVEGPWFEWLRGDELADRLPWRQREAHKGDLGHLLVVAGSTGKSGAAVLAARAAVRTGAGLVTAAVPASLLGVLESASLESMTLPLAEEHGELAAEAVAAVIAAAGARDAVAIGPGLGRGDGPRQLVAALYRDWPGPMVLDADALYAFEGEPERLRDRPGPTVLTPHPGELAALTGWARDEIQADRPTAARRAAEATGTVVVLKGHQTLVATPGGRLAINGTGNSGLASGGSGDVLTGIVGALLAQGEDATDAAEVGVCLHGRVADRVGARMGLAALAASDLVDDLGNALREAGR